MSATAERYHAFISYSHAEAREVARLLQRSIEAFGSTLRWRRRLRVFRDETNLAASPDLWSSVEAALDRSNYLILLASPRSAASEWVDREIRHFLARNPLSRFGIVLVAGSSPWTDADASSQPSSISPTVQALFEEAGGEPLIVDLREFAGDRRRKPSGLEFLGRVASVVAAILGVDKDQVYGEHLRAQRRAILGLTVGLVAITALAVLAVVQTRLARHRLTQAVAVARHINEVVEERLLPIAGAATVRRELLDASGRLLDDLLGQPGGSGPLVQLQRVQAHNRRGYLAFDHEALDAARSQFDSALTIAQRAPRRVEAEWPWAAEVARARRGLGDAFEAAGDLARAAREFEGARTVIARFAQPGSESVAPHRQMSATLGRLVTVHMARGDLAEASRVLDEALAIDRSMVERSPADATLAAFLAGSYIQAGDLAVERSELDRADSLYGSAQALLDSLASVDSLNAEFQSSWADAMTGRGIVQLNRGRRQQAVVLFDTARARLAALVEREPTQVLWQRMLSAAIANIGSAFESIGELATAGRHFEDALSILVELGSSQPSNALLTASRMELELHLGDVASESGAYGTAHAYYERHRAGVDSLRRQDPTNSRWAYSLITSHDRLGILWMNRGDTARARQAYASMNALADSMIRLHPNSWSWRFIRSQTLAKMAEAAEWEGDLSGAAAAYEGVVSSLDSLLRRDSRHLPHIAWLGHALFRLGRVLMLARKDDAALPWLLRADSLHRLLVAEDSTRVEWGVHFTESSARLAEIYTRAERYEDAKRHLARCTRVARVLAAENPALAQAVYATTLCQSRLVVLADWQKDDLALLQASTDLFIQRAKLVALAPEDAVNRQDLETTREVLFGFLQEADSAHARASIRRLRVAASTFERTLPAAAATLHSFGAAVAMDLLAEPELALPFTSAQRRQRSADASAHCGHAEVLLALRRDTSVVREAIGSCLRVATTPSFIVIARALHLTFGVVVSSVDLGDRVNALVAAVEKLGKRPIEWSFAGLRRVLGNDERPFASAVALLEALEATDPSERLVRVTGASRSLR